MFCFFLRSLPFSLCSCGCLENGGCRRFPETLPPLFRSRHRSLIQKWLLQKKKKKTYLWVHIIFWRAHFFFLIFVSFESCWPGRWQTLFLGTQMTYLCKKEIQTEISSLKSCSSTLKNLQPDPFQAWFEYDLGQSPHFRWKEKFASGWSGKQPIGDIPAHS